MELLIPAGFEPLVVTGAACALAAAALTILWLGAMVRFPLPSTDAVEELAAIAARPGLQVPRFGPTTLVAVAYVPMWLALAAVMWNGAPSAGIIATGFGLLYPPLCATGYWLQYTTVRAIAALHGNDPAPAAAAYEIVGFHERPTSVSGNLVILGYAVWGLGGLAAGIGLLTFEGGAEVTTAVLFLVTAGLTLIGAAGHVARNRILAVAVMASGVTSLGATIGTAVVLFGTL